MIDKIKELWYKCFNCNTLFIKVANGENCPNCNKAVEDE